jgi:serine/threonine protein kinase
MYEFGTCLGVGLHGKVYEAVHVDSKEKVAIKAINKSVITRDQMRIAKYLDEIEILKHISHPNVVRILEVYETPEKYYIVTELLYGGELFNLISKFRHISEKFVAQIMH